MGDQYEPIVFGGDPPPPPKTPQASDPFDDNHYEIPTFGNNKNKVPPPPPPPPAGKEKSIASDSLASHKGRLSYQDKHGGKNKKQKLNASAIKNYKKNKTKGSMQQDDLKSDVKSPNDPTGGDPFEEGGENNNNKKGRATKSFEKKSGGKSKSGVISVSNKPSAEGGTKTSAEVRSSMAATGTDGKPKRKKTAQEIIAERQRYRGSVKKDLIITLIIVIIALVVIISTIIGIGAASDFNFGDI